MRKAEENDTDVKQQGASPCFHKRAEGGLLTQQQQVVRDEFYPWKTAGNETGGTRFSAETHVPRNQSIDFTE